MGNFSNMKRRRSLAICLAAAALTYAGLSRLSPPFESESVLLLQDGFKPSGLSGQSLGVAALFADVASNSNLRMLRQVLLSDETVVELDKRVHLFTWIGEHGNLYERLLADAEDPSRRTALLEHLATVDIDDRAGLVHMRVRAHQPAYAQRIATALVAIAQARMNDLAQRAARDQIDFMERETRRLAEADAKAQQRLQEYQSKSGLTAAEIGISVGTAGISPVGPEALVLWQQKLGELQVKRNSMRQFLREDAPEILQIDAEIQAVQGQIRTRKDDLLPRAQAKSNLSQARLDFANLMYEASLSKEMYLGAVRVTMQTRAEASSTLKRVDTVQAPTLPVRPDRGSTVLQALAAALVAVLVWHLLGTIKRYVQSHQD